MLQSFKCRCKGTTKKSKYQILGIKFYKKNTLFLFLCTLHGSQKLCIRTSQLLIY